MSMMAPTRLLDVNPTASQHDLYGSMGSAYTVPNGVETYHPQHSPTISLLPRRMLGH